MLSPRPGASSGRSTPGWGSSCTSYTSYTSYYSYYSYYSYDSYDSYNSYYRYASYYNYDSYNSYILGRSSAATGARSLRCRAASDNDD